MTRDLAAAARAVEAAMGGRGWNVRDLAREADADAGTVGDFLAGSRWPRPSTRGKIERALGWPAGTIRDVSEGGQPPRDEIGRPAVTTDLAALLADDPTLSAASRAHIVNQYRLLQQLSALELHSIDEEDPDERAIAESRELSPAQKQEALQALRERRGHTESDAPAQRRGVR